MPQHIMEQYKDKVWNYFPNNKKIDFKIQFVTLFQVLHSRLTATHFLVESPVILLSLHSNTDMYVHFYLA